MTAMRFKIICVIAATLLLILTVQFTVNGSVQRVLIAHQSSEFKNEIVDALHKGLKNSGIEVTVDDISVLRRINEKEWDAIVIIHAVKMGKIKKRVRQYLDRVDNWSKVIILTTYGSKDPVPDMYGIDSISSASEKSELNTVITELKSRVQSVLNSDN